MAVGIPATVWRPTDGNSEFTDTGVNYIVDTADFYLVDTTGFYVVDTGVTNALIPSTVWEEDDSI